MGNDFGFEPWARAAVERGQHISPEAARELLTNLDTARRERDAARTVRDELRRDRDAAVAELDRVRVELDTIRMDRTEKRGQAMASRMIELTDQLTKDTATVPVECVADQLSLWNPGPWVADEIREFEAALIAGKDEARGLAEYLAVEFREIAR